MKKSELKAIVNPILASYVAKGLLPYRGIGSGIQRALEAWPEIDFIDDREGCLFTATVHRKALKGSEKILIMLKAEPELTSKEIAKRLEISPRAVEKQISKLRKEGLLHRIGPDKGGRWEVR
jgi:ATP-dependent DNA helicase RecG